MFGGTRIFEGAGDVAKSKFFEERTDQSVVKARIFQKNFYAWANVIIKAWGCDCVFFCNYNRINASMTNAAVEKHIDALFGEERAARLRALLPSKQPHEREEIILEELAQAIKEMGGKFVLPFRFK